MDNFEGHQPRECGEHRTVGSHRAWCHECTEWCYPSDGCKGCRLGQLDAWLDLDRIFPDTADAKLPVYEYIDAAGNRRGRLVPSSCS